MIAYGQPPRQMTGMRYAMTGERDDSGGGQLMPGMRLGQLMAPQQFNTGAQLPSQQINPMTGGNLPAQPFNPQAAPQFNGQYPQGSYGMNAQHGGSNGGINPGGMYGAPSAGFGQPTYPAGLAQLFSSYRFR